MSDRIWVIETEEGLRVTPTRPRYEGAYTEYVRATPQEAEGEGMESMDEDAWGKAYMRQMEDGRPQYEHYRKILAEKAQPTESREREAIVQHLQWAIDNHQDPKEGIVEITIDRAREIVATLGEEVDDES